MKPTIISVEVSRTGYTPSITGTIGSAVNSIGGTGQAGGIIFYVDTAATVYPGKTYLEAAPTDMGTYAWAPYGSAAYETPGVSGTGTDIEDGQANTAAILAVDPNAPAAKACADYGNGTAFDDWFLPSQDELHAIWTSGIATTANGFNLNFNIFYWSSSQSTGYSAYRKISLSGNKDDYPKSYVFNVRAVRAF